MRYELERAIKNGVFNQNDLDKYIRGIESEIESLKNEIKEVEEYGAKRITYINDCINLKKYHVLGRTFKNGKTKVILCILRFEDGAQLDIRKSFDKISDMRAELIKLKDTYSGVDWSRFEEEI